MKKIFPSGQYKKDLKRYLHQPAKLEVLGQIIDMLANEQLIPARYKPHMLLGQYKGCMECHVQGNFLLIWLDEERDIIELVRLGTHSELFE